MLLIKEALLLQFFRVAQKVDSLLEISQLGYYLPISMSSKPESMLLGATAILPSNIYSHQELGNTHVYRRETAGSFDMLVSQGPSQESKGKALKHK